MALMDVVGSFAAILQVFTDLMNVPTAQTFQTLTTGWLLAPRRMILGMVRASGSDRHHAAFHRLFATARWSVDQVGLKIFDLLTSGQQTIFLSGDDTLLARSLRNWPGKRCASFADILACLRMKTLENTLQTNLSTPETSPGVNKYLQYLSHLIELAA